MAEYVALWLSLYRASDGALLDGASLDGAPLDGASLDGSLCWLPSLGCPPSAFVVTLGAAGC